MPEIMSPDPTAAGHVPLEGALTVRNVAEIHSRLRESLRQYSTVTIDCNAATDVDLSFLQLVLSARKSATVSGKSVSLVSPATDMLSETLRRAGLLGVASASARDDQLFWLHKEAVDGKDDSLRR